MLIEIGQGVSFAEQSNLNSYIYNLDSICVAPNSANARISINAKEPARQRDCNG